jgi:cysteine desulfurase
VPEGWSLLAASARKWGGPAGVGLLAVRKGTRWREPFPSDDRENRRVPGFPNVPAVLAAAASLTAMSRERPGADTALRALVSRVRSEVPRTVPDSVVHGDPDSRLPHIVTFSCLYVDGEALVTELDRAGFSVSSGSACVADTRQPSHVLAAMGALTHGNVRVSLPRDVRAASVSEFLEALPPIVAKVRDTVRAANAAAPYDPATPRTACGGSRVSRQQRRARPVPGSGAPSGIRRSALGLGQQPVPAADQGAPAQAGPAPVLILDALGKKCPIPIIMLADRIGEVRIGQTVEVLADDPAAKTDLPAWCALKSHEFVRTAALPAGWSFLVRRSY